MAYTIDLTNGDLLTTIDNEVADTTTSLTLLGRNYAGYGTILATNFVHLLENFADSTAPSAPLTGQIWYDATAGYLKFWNGSDWIEPGSLSTSTVFYDSAAPSGSRYYRLRVRDDGEFVLESLNDDLTINTVISDTTNVGVMGFAGRLSLNDGGTIYNSGTWSSSNIGKQLLLTTAGSNPPSLGITDQTGANLWAMFNNSGSLQFAKMPAYSNTGSAITNALQLTASGARVYGTLQIDGVATAPTAAGGTNTTQVATTAFVTTSFAPLASPALTGTPTAPTAAGGTNTTQLATTAFVTTSFAPLASPTLTGTPTAPTAAAGTNTTQLATTAFVQAIVHGIQVFYSSGTFTVPAGVFGIDVEIWGAGGGGYGSAVNGPAAGGGGGGYARKLILGLTPGASYAVTVGTGGAGGLSGGNVGAGGLASSFGAFASATGGTAGTDAAGGLDGIGSGGDINLTGGVGGGSVPNLTAFDGGMGGGSPGNAGPTPLAGGAIGSYFPAGGGGGGGSTIGPQAGGDGSDGLVIVRW